jgi:flagellin
LNSEFTALRSEIDRISNSTQFNGIGLLSGTLSNVAFQVGLNNNATNDRITVTISSTLATSIGISAAASLSTAANAQGALSILDTAISAVAARRGSVGALQNRFLTTINNLQSSHENLSASASRIADADVASESASFARTQILMQAGLSVLSQANQLPQMALMLIAG